jgi:hypothetical protein
MAEMTATVIDDQVVHAVMEYPFSEAVRMKEIHDLERVDRHRRRNMASKGEVKAKGNK